MNSLQMAALGAITEIFLLKFKFGTNSNFELWTGDRISHRFASNVLHFHEGFVQRTHEHTCTLMCVCRVVQFAQAPPRKSVTLRTSIRADVPNCTGKGFNVFFQCLRYAVVSEVIVLFADGISVQTLVSFVCSFFFWVRLFFGVFDFAGGCVGYDCLPFSFFFYFSSSWLM